MVNIIVIISLEIYAKNCQWTSFLVPACFRWNKLGAKKTQISENISDNTPKHVDGPTKHGIEQKQISRRL